MLGITLYMLNNKNLISCAQTPKNYQEWLKINQCTHAHCIRGDFWCPKPQPLMLNNQLICGHCLVIDSIISEMVPCTPEVCN